MIKNCFLSVCQVQSHAPQRRPWYYTQRQTDQGSLAVRVRSVCVYTYGLWDTSHWVLSQLYFVTLHSTHFAPVSQPSGWSGNCIWLDNLNCSLMRQNTVFLRLAILGNMKSSLDDMCLLSQNCRGPRGCQLSLLLLLSSVILSFLGTCSVGSCRNLYEAAPSKRGAISFLAEISFWQGSGYQTQCPTQPNKPRLPQHPSFLFPE